MATKKGGKKAAKKAAPKAAKKAAKKPAKKRQFEPAGRKNFHWRTSSSKVQGTFQKERRTLNEVRRSFSFSSLLTTVRIDLSLVLNQPD